MVETAIAWVICVAIVSAFGLKAWSMWLKVQPACTTEEFQKVVKQVNTLTESMSQVVQTADSMRAAVGMARIGTVQR